MSASWHAVRTVSNREKEVAKHLQDSDIPAFTPMVTVTTIRNGRSIERRQALFRNYTFSQWENSDPKLWHSVKDTRGVIKIIGGEHPTPIQPGVVEHWQQCASDAVSAAELEATLADIRRGYKVGSAVRLQKGRDDAMKGIVAWVDDREQRVGVRVEILGRQPIIVRNQRDVEAVDAPLYKQARRRQRGGKRGTRARKQAFVKYVASALQTSS